MERGFIVLVVVVSGRDEWRGEGSYGWGVVAIKKKDARLESDVILCQSTTFTKEVLYIS